MRLSSTINDYACDLARDCDIDSTCLFISDKTTGSTELYYLGNFGVNEEVLSRYRHHGICDADPFTDTLRHEAANDELQNFRVPSHPLIERCGARANSYWRFCAAEGIEVVGAATMKLQPRLYLTLGAHRARSDHPRGAVPLERLAYRIEVLQNKVAASLLSSLMAGGKGYQSLLSMFREDRPAPDTRLAQLSARETEIARLVCTGKQNKEIAWVASVSECTVENHLRRIYQKLGIHNRVALVAQMNGGLN